MIVLLIAAQFSLFNAASDHSGHKSASSVNEILKLSGSVTFLDLMDMFEIVFYRLHAIVLFFKSKII